MASQPALQVRKKSSPRTSQLSPETLLKSLLDQLVAQNPNDTSDPSDANDGSSPLFVSGDGPETEEVIFDAMIDGNHYLLIRLPRTQHPKVKLSPREQEIVRMVAKGHPNKIIADVLNISCWTVSTHLRRIYAKLGVSSRAATVARTMENGAGREHQPDRESKL